MTSLRGALAARSTSPARRVDSAVRRRRRRVIAALLLVLALTGLVAGLAAQRVERPPLTSVSTNGTTAVPPTWFFQPPYVLYAPPPTSPRPATLAAFGCEADGDLRVPDPPRDLTRFGSRVVQGTSVTAAVLVGRTSGEGHLTCSSTAATSAGGPAGTLWLAPASTAPPFAPTAMIIGAVVLFVGAVLVNPGLRTR